MARAEMAERQAERLEICPCCERKFTNLRDFPKVYVARFERAEVPSDLKIRGSVRDLFVHPDKSSSRNPKIPAAVIELFQNPKIFQHGQQYVEYRGWEWARTWREGGLEEAIFELFRDDVRNIVDYNVNKFLARVDEMVGQEVPSGLLHPPSLPKAVPQSLRFREGPQYEEGGFSPKGFKVAKLQLEYLNGGSIQIVRTTATFGTLYYEGRINELPTPVVK